MNIPYERMIRFMEMALVLALVLMLGRNVWPFVNGSHTALAPKLAVSEDVSSAGSAKIDTSVLRRFDLFYRKDVATKKTVAETAPETTLDLKIFGMRADLNGDSSSAIIQTPDQKQAAYFIGDEIIPGVTLSSVEIDYVIIDRNGVTERLSRQTDDSEAGSILSSIESGPLAFKAADMLNDLRFFPHREGKEVLGYKIRGRRASMIEKYGFQRNDIITAINGEDLTQNIVNLPNLWKNLKKARYASIQIIRDDTPMTIEVNLQ